MDALVKLDIETAENELILAKALLKLSESNKKKEVLEVEDSRTFYNAVISHAYYSIFFSARAYIRRKRINIPEQGQHQSVYMAFKKLVQQGTIDSELLILYEEVKIKAEVLLDLMKTERDKRTQFTYKSVPSANKEPAEDSVKNAEQFYKCLFSLLNTLENKK